MRPNILTFGHVDMGNAHFFGHPCLVFVRTFLNFFLTFTAFLVWHDFNLLLRCLCCWNTCWRPHLSWLCPVASHPTLKRLNKLHHLLHLFLVLDDLLPVRDLGGLEDPFPKHIDIGHGGKGRLSERKL